MKICEAFDQTLKDFGISGKELAIRSSVSQAHISQFRNGKGGDVAHTTLERLLQTVEEMRPGARQHFYLLMAGVDHAEVDEAILKLRQARLSPDQVAELIQIAAAQLKACPAKLPIAV